MTNEEKFRILKDAGVFVAGDLVLEKQHNIKMVERERPEESPRQDEGRDVTFEKRHFSLFLKGTGRCLTVGLP